ncbi:MAG: hypothetical protein ABUT20_42510 [Bacteroidota bacterium]
MKTHPFILEGFFHFIICCIILWISQKPYWTRLSGYLRVFFKTRHPISNEWGMEAPRLKDFIIVFLVVLILIAFSWITYYKFGWFH